MEQRRLRLGDILDDYCPRERRITNHAVVAMIQDDVKQTRCTTCDAEHVYKGGKAPRKRKATTTGALYKEVLAGIEDPVTPAVDAEPEFIAEPDAEPTIPSHIPDAPVLSASDASESSESIESSEPDDVDDDVIDDDSQIHLLPPDEGPVHRPLIRAQLPRPEGMKVERQAPEFTIRQNNGSRGGGFRARGNGHGNGNASGAHRFGRSGNRGDRRGPQGFGRGPGGGQQRHGGGPRKRSR